MVLVVSGKTCLVLIIVCVWNWCYNVASFNVFVCGTKCFLWIFLQNCLHAKLTTALREICVQTLPSKKHRRCFCKYCSKGTTYYFSVYNIMIIIKFLTLLIIRKILISRPVFEKMVFKVEVTLWESIENISRRFFANSAIKVWRTTFSYIKENIR